MPTAIRGPLRGLRQLASRVYRRTRSPRSVFTQIYGRNAWGGAQGDFCSGSGSSTETIVGPYIEVIGILATKYRFTGKTFVDLGCGDFRVGHRLLPFCSRYIGVDVVEELIAYNNLQYGNAHVSFITADIVSEMLPTGQICFLRQVLQHLSNRQISAILRKVKQYEMVFITEHYPSEWAAVRPNIDKVQGGDVRAAVGSGVYLDLPPFRLPASELTKVLEVPGSGLGPGEDQGVVRTYLYSPLRDQSRW
jgi:SAM-dependent methyltransferase